MFNVNLAMTFTGIISFLTYFGSAVVMTALFLIIYGLITPYEEVRLISEGNAASAYSYGGALLGFAIPLAGAISHSVGVLDMIIWAGLALVIQVITFLIVRLVMPHIVSDIPDNKVSCGVFLGVLSLAAGIINAACMTY